jgi:voltage-gated sodium channel
MRACLTDAKSPSAASPKLVGKKVKARKKTTSNTYTTINSASSPDVEPLAAMATSNGAFESITRPTSHQIALCATNGADGEVLSLAEARRRQVLNLAEEIFAGTVGAAPSINLIEQHQLAQLDRRGAAETWLSQCAIDAAADENANAFRALPASHNAGMHDRTGPSCHYDSRKIDGRLDDKGVDAIPNTREMTASELVLELKKTSQRTIDIIAATMRGYQSEVQDILCTHVVGGLGDCKNILNDKSIDQRVCQDSPTPDTEVPQTDLLDVHTGAPHATTEARQVLIPITEPVPRTSVQIQLTETTKAQKKVLKDKMIAITSPRRVRLSEMGESDGKNKKASVLSVVSAGRAGTKAAALLPNTRSVVYQKKRMGQVFPDVISMKKALKSKLGIKDYSVADLYHSGGVCQMIAKSPIFEYLTLTVIALNGLWIAYDTDQNPSSTGLIVDSPFLPYGLVEHSFCTYFMLELLIRFRAFEVKANCLRDRWFCFDSFLVTQAIVEVWVVSILYLCGVRFTGLGGAGTILTVAKLFRVFRTARLVRMLRQFPEIVVLIRGVKTALRSVFFTMVFMCVATYMFAIAMTILLKNDKVGEMRSDETFDHYFSSVWISMRRLLMWACFPDIEEAYLIIIRDAGWLPTILFTVFLFLISLTLLNMLIGVLVEVVSVISVVEVEKSSVAQMKEGVLDLLAEIDDTFSGSISGKEYLDFLANEDAIIFLSRFDIDVRSLVDLESYFFEDDRVYDYAEFIGILLELRGHNHCTVKDIVELRKWLEHNTQSMLSEMRVICTTCTAAHP